MKNKPTTESIPGFHVSVEQMPLMNKLYVDKSMAIAHKVNSRIRELGLTKIQLAEKLATTSQEAEEICRGKKLLNLRTITKLEAILNIEIITIL